MSRARDLSKLGNINVLSADDVSNEVGIATTVPRSTLDVRGEIKVGTAIQAGSAGVVTATSFSGSGANLTGLATTETVRADTLTVAGVSTFTGVSNFSAAVNVDSGLIETKGPLIDNIKKMKHEIAWLETSLKDIEEDLEALLLSIPNLLSDDVPIGQSETENVEVYRWGK